MSLSLLRRLSRCSSSSLDQCITSLSQNVDQRLAAQLQGSCLRQQCHQFSSVSVNSSAVLASLSNNARHQSWQRATAVRLSNRELCRHLSLSCSALRKRTKDPATGSASEEQSPNADGSTPRKPNIQHLLENSADPSVPPVGKDKKIVMFEEGPYPKNTTYERSQAKYSCRPTTDPGTTSIVLFPGQGTQYVGMGQELLEMPSVQEMYAAASEILGYDLKKASLEGPLKFLSRTQVQQPAILVASLAAVERLRESNPIALQNCVATAGFSVGEITALTFAGALTFEDAIRLIKVRSEAMQLASEMTPGGMMTAFFGADCRLGLCCSTAKEFCLRRDIPNAECRVASYLWPICKVVAGSEEALQFLQENMKDFNIRRLKRLNVSGAFHTAHMGPAAVALEEALKDMNIETPNIPVHSNIDGKPYSNPEQIRRNLPKQIHSPVKWEQTMHILYERDQGMKFPQTFECGPGQSLKAILKMVNQRAVENMENIVA